MKDLKPLFSDDFSFKRPFVIAGPCSVESVEQVSETGRLLSDMGILFFRAGIWKPRTKPGSFEGIGSVGLKWLTDLVASTGQTPMIEIATPYHAREALQAGIHNFWIGARTAANPFAVQDLADFFASLSEKEKDGITILMKNPVNPDIELWIGSLQRIYESGIRRLGAIHRGFSSYDSSPFRNSPEWRVPIELKYRMPELPLFCDPSHIAGKADLVPEIARQALELKFDGLFIEVHNCPQKALSDAAQQLTPAHLKELMDSFVSKNDSSGAEGLVVLREKIDSLDARLLQTLAERMEISREIGEFKKQNNMPVLQPARYDDLMKKRSHIGESLGLNPKFVKNILSAIHEESVRQQVEINDSRGRNQ